MSTHHAVVKYIKTSGQYDIAVVGPAEFGVARANKNEQFQTSFMVLVRGYMCEKDGGKLVTNTASWCFLRKFDDMEDAMYMRNQLSMNHIDYDQINEWQLPAKEAVGEHVDTVADIHRKLRR